MRWEKQGNITDAVGETTTEVWCLVGTEQIQSLTGRYARHETHVTKALGSLLVFEDRVEYVSYTSALQDALVMTGKSVEECKIAALISEELAR